MLALGDAGFLHEGGNEWEGLEFGHQFAGVVEELLAPAEVVFEDVVELGAGGDLDGLAVEFGGGAEALGIPGRNFAEHAAAELFAEDFDHEVEVAGHDADALGEGRFGGEGGTSNIERRTLNVEGVVLVSGRRNYSGLTVRVAADRNVRAPGLQVLQGALEDPGVVEGAAADADARAAGFVEHLFGGFGGDDVAVADDGNAFDGLDDGADAGKVHRAAEALFARAAVDENGGDADVFEGTGEVGRGEVLVVPAEAHFGGDGDFNGVDHAFDERGGFTEFGHHGGTAADFADLADGAAHVDIHGGDADGFEVGSGVAHFLGDGAEELDGERGIRGASLDELESFVAFFEERTGIDEIGGAKAHAADFAHDEAERQVGVTRQGREEQIRC